MLKSILSYLIKLRTCGLQIDRCPFKHLGSCSPEMFVGRKKLIIETLDGSQEGFAIKQVRGQKLLLLLDEMDNLILDNNLENHFINKLRSKTNEGTLRLIIAGFQNITAQISNRLWEKK